MFGVGAGGRRALVFFMLPGVSIARIKPAIQPAFGVRGIPSALSARGMGVWCQGLGSPTPGRRCLCPNTTLDVVLGRAMLPTVLLSAYLVGAVPFSVLVGRALRDVDVRHAGTGNTG